MSKSVLELGLLYVDKSAAGELFPWCAVLLALPFLCRVIFMLSFVVSPLGVAEVSLRSLGYGTEITGATLNCSMLFAYCVLIMLLLLLLRMRVICIHCCYCSSLYLLY